MKRTIEFGKIAYNSERKDNMVSADIELVEKKDGNMMFLARCRIWNRIFTDIICGGQSLTEIKQYIKSAYFDEIYELWKKYQYLCIIPETDLNRIKEIINK